MAKFVPDLIAENYKKNILSGKLNASVLFSDISGFTAAAEKLSVRGKEGSEILSEIIRTLFETTSDIIKKRGGFITKYIGDAFIAVFPDDGKTLDGGGRSFISAVSAALELKDYFSSGGLLTTRAGKLHFGIKSSVSKGICDWKIIGKDGYRTYYFSGEPVESATGYEKYLKAGDIAVGAEQMIPYSRQIRTATGRDRSYKNVISVKTDEPRRAPTKKEPSASRTLNEIFAGKPETSLSEGEFRNVVTVYISVSSECSISEVFEVCAELSDAAGGGRPSVFLSDKGWNILVFFGAPVSRGDIRRRSLDFVSSLFRTKTFEGRLKAGVTEGVLYSGYTGSESFREFTCFGLKVNLAARMMTAAQKGEILTDRSVSSEHGYLFEYAGDKDFKGITGKTSVFRLMGRSAAAESSKSESVFGREKEKAVIKDHISAHKTGINPGPLLIRGEEGIGKSVLLRSVMKETGKDRKWIFLTPESINGKSFSPAISALNSIFGIDSGRNSLSLEHFNSIYDKIVTSCSDKQVSEETSYGRSFIAGLLDLEIRNSVHSRTHGKLRRDNYITSLKSFFKCLSLTEPLVMVFEDIHWIDGDTREFIRQMTVNTEKFPFAVIMLERTDGTNDPKTVLPFSKILELDKLGSGDIRSIVASVFRIHVGKVPSELAGIFSKITSGNPFFAEQLALYFRDNDMLDGEMKLKLPDLELPAGITSVVTARIDSLASDIREIIKTASVLGTQVNLDVLSAMLDGKDLGRYTEETVKEDIWYQIDSILYMFRHVLIKDTAYGMILKRKLRELHLAAAEAIESCCRYSSKKYCYELAEHFYRAESYKKALKFAKISSNKAKRNYSNVYFEKYLKRILDLIPLLKMPESRSYNLEKETLLELEHFYYLTAEMHKRDEISRKLNSLYKRKKDPELKIDIHLIEYKLKVYKGKTAEAMKYAKKALRLALENGLEKKSAYSEYSVSNVYMRQGRYSKCRGHLETALNIYKKYNHLTGLGLCYNALGLLSSDEKKWDESLKYFNDQIIISRRTGDFEGAIASFNNIAIIYFKQKDYASARKYFMKVLRFSEKLGHKLAYSTALLNIGLMEYIRGNFPKALEYYHKKLSISEELEDFRGMMNAYNNIATIMFDTGEYDKAVEYFLKNIGISEKLGMNYQIARAHYNIAQAYSVNFELEKSFRHAFISLGIYKKEKDAGDMSKIYNYIGYLYQKQGDLSKAAKMSSEAVRVMNDRKDDGVYHEYLLGYCDILYEKGEKEKFSELFPTVCPDKFEDDKMVVYHVNKIRSGILNGTSSAEKVFRETAEALKCIKSGFHRAAGYYKLAKSFSDHPVQRSLLASESLKLLSRDNLKVKNREKEQMTEELESFILKK